MSFMYHCVYHYTQALHTQQFVVVYNDAFYFNGYDIIEKYGKKGDVYIHDMVMMNGTDSS